MREEMKALFSLVEAMSEINGGKGTGGSHSIREGEKYIIRADPMYYVGRVLAITDCDLVLGEASWVADTGRWSNALQTGELSEVEPFVGKVIINRTRIVDMTVWGHNLPSEVK